jgi:hypothetical protein
MMMKEKEADELQRFTGGNSPISLRLSYASTPLGQHKNIHNFSKFSGCVRNRA